MRHIPPMRLGYFTMPLHPPHRDPAQTLQEDREAVLLADGLDSTTPSSVSTSPTAARTSPTASFSSRR